MNTPDEIAASKTHLVYQRCVGSIQKRRRNRSLMNVGCKVQKVTDISIEIAMQSELASKIESYEPRGKVDEDIQKLVYCNYSR
ncbi:hypothetical protein PMm318_A42450 [Pseudomonas moorei]